MAHADGPYIRSTFFRHSEELPAHIAVHEIQAMIGKAIPFARHSVNRPPLAAFGQGLTGHVCLGVNVELPAVPGVPPHHTTISAVQFLVANFAHRPNPERELRILAVSPDGTHFVPPSVHDCQFLNEIRNAPQIQTLIQDPNGVICFPLLRGLFNMDNVMGDVPRLLDHRNLGLRLLVSDETICPRPLQYAVCGHFRCMALAAADRSYAPYTQSPSGVILKDIDGIHSAGWYLESAVPELSLGPLQAALVKLVTGGGKGFETITKVALVERRNANVRQEAEARRIIQRIAPDCHFQVFHCL